MKTYEIYLYLPFFILEIKLKIVDEVSWLLPIVAVENKSVTGLLTKSDHLSFGP